MKKTAFIGIFTATLMASTSASADPATNCLTKYGTHIVPRVAMSMEESCRQFLFPPKPGDYLYTLGGPSIQTIALAGVARYGHSVEDISSISAEYRVFLFPARPGEKGYTFKVPSNARGGLH